MKALQKIWYVILGLLLAAAGVLIFLIGIRYPLGVDKLFTLTYEHYSFWFVVTLIIGVLVFLLGLWTVISLFARREKTPSQAEVSAGDQGKVSIGVPAMENIIRSSAAKISEVQDLKVKIKCLPHGVAVLLNCVLQADANVPAVTQALQNAVKQDLENMAGLTVEEVRVIVSSVAAAGTNQA